MPTFDVIVHIFVYFDNFYEISYNIVEEIILWLYNTDTIRMAIQHQSPGSFLPAIRVVPPATLK